MDFLNLTRTTVKRIVLRGRPRVLFVSNRSQNLTFSFEKAGAGAHIFALYIGKKTDNHTLSVTQRHAAPQTTSHLTVLSILDGHARFSYDGLIRIEHGAIHSDASQDNKNLLLSEAAHASSRPTLEILADDVSARHASATGTIESEAILLAESRSISPNDARKLLAEGAVKSFFDTMRTLTDDPAVDDIEKKSLRRLSAGTQ